MLEEKESDEKDSVAITEQKSQVAADHNLGTEKIQSVPKEYTSLLTKQLSPSPESSETSSLHDEVADLPVSMRRQRGHTIAAIQTTSPTSQTQDLSRTGKDTKVGISPSFVFLQLYHNGQLQVNDVPLLLPENEVTSYSYLPLKTIFCLDKIKGHFIFFNFNRLLCKLQNGSEIKMKSEVTVISFHWHRPIKH